MGGDWSARRRSEWGRKQSKAIRVTLPGTLALTLNIIFVLVKLYYDLASTSNTFIRHGRKLQAENSNLGRQVHCRGQMQRISFWMSLIMPLHTSRINIDRLLSVFKDKNSLQNSGLDRMQAKKITWADTSKQKPIANKLALRSFLWNREVEFAQGEPTAWLPQEQLYTSLTIGIWLISEKKKHIHLLSACMIIVSYTLRAHIIYLVGSLLEQISLNFIWVHTSNNEFDVCI
jgi:hypothetical protein